MLFKSKKMKVGLIAHHNPMRFLDSSGFGDFSSLDAKISVWFENRALRKVDQVSAPSEYMGEWFQKTYHFSGPVEIIPNLVDLSELQDLQAHNLHKQFELPPSAIMIGIPSGEMPIKGTKYIPELLSKISSQIEQSIGVFIGGLIHSDLKTALNDLPPSIKVFLPGNLARLDYLSYMKACSFGIFPATMDNYSMALIEAGALGVPMLAFNAGGNQDIIQNDQNGYLIEAFDVDKMALKAIDWIRDPDALLKLRANTQMFAQGAMNPDRILERYIDYFFPDLDNSTRD
jgi:glycosyltransferase involved in cell wall biosynthesis